MSAIDHHLNTILVRAAAEARQDGSPATEAQHLLLALAADTDTSARRLLADAGLAPQPLREALDREFAHSLAAVGVSAAAFDLPAPSPRPARPEKITASGRLAIERAFAAARHKKDMRPCHLLIGILDTAIGTVPRALALAGVDRLALLGRAREALAAGAW